ncbi:MAG TPA: hypothetical protein VFA89_12300 [Terriglobales bacterium]|nr:hypothetical protein [Terriglobales bacterium]
MNFGSQDGIMDRAQANWTDVYELAMHENDPAFVRQRIEAARSAIRARDLELITDPVVNHAERMLLDIALQSLALRERQHGA